MLFLENGGGKSVLIKLIFSVMLPGKRQIVGTSNTRVLEKFVGDREVAHVVLEWMHTETGRLLVTGKLSEWRQRKNSTDDALSETWYSLRPGRSVGIMSLPFAEGDDNLAAKPFRDRLAELDHDDPTLELFWADKHARWAQRLTSLGIDPELFEFQRRMNAGEGEAADAFTFGTDEALVDFLLKAVLPDADTDSLGEALGRYSATLSERDKLELERDFVAATLEQLDPLAQQHGMVEAERQLVSAQEAERNRFAASVLGRIEQERQRASTASEQLLEAQAVFTAAEQAVLAASDVRAELIRRAALFRVEEATGDLGTAEKRLSDASVLVDSWKATDPLADWATKTARVDQLNEVLQELEDKAAAAKRVRDDRAGHLVQLLLEAVAEAERDTSAKDSEATELAKRAAAAQTAHDEAVAEQATARTKAESLEEAVAQVAAEVDEAVSDGLVADPRSVTAAADSLATAARDAAAVVTSQQEKIAELEARSDHSQAALADARRDEGTAQVEHDKAVAAVTAAKSAMTALAGKERLIEMVEGTEPVLETDAEPLIGRLTEALSATERQRTNLRVEGAADDRARLVLDSGEDALYPPPPEIEQLVRLLRNEQVPCYAGWDVLADLPDDEVRRELVLRYPHLASGVLLNNPGDLDRARQLVQARGYEPTYLVAVASTQSFDLDPEQRFDLTPQGDAGFMVPPLAALYDHDAARAESSRINRRHADRHERLAELDKRHADDLELRTLLAQWRMEYPPGRFAELFGRQTATGNTLSTAQTVVSSCVENVGKIKVLRDSARLALAGLMETARVAGEQAVRIERLRDRVMLASGWNREAEERRTSERTAGLRVLEQRSRRDEFAVQAVERRRLADTHRATAVRLNEEISRVGGAEKADPGTPRPGHSVEVLRKIFQEAEVTYIKAQVGSNFLADVANAEQAANDARVILDKVPEAIRERAAKLLETSEGADAAGRAAASATADAKRAKAAGLRDSALRVQSECQTRYNALPAPRTEVVLPEQPADVRHAEQLLADAENAWKTAEAVARDKQAEQHTLEKSLQRVQEAIAGFVRVTDALTMTDDLAPSSRPEITASFAGTPEAAWVRNLEMRKVLKESRTRLRDARAGVSRAIDALLTKVAEAKYHHLVSHVRTQITTVPRAELPAHAAAWAVALRPRLRSLIDDLAQLERFRAVTVTRLQGMVEHALGTLRHAQRLSRLPPGLGDWSGEEFLRFAFKPVEGEVLTQHLSDVVDSTARESVKRDGTSILLRGVRAAAPRGFKVTMLKPDAVLRTERVRVSEVRDVFSGGQHLTAAIMLYCTLAALRSNNQGRAGRRHSGVLFLDNPIGRASAGYLLDLQRAVAAALGVQLVYTTGLFDAEALSTFPLLVRLRNDADLRAGRKYLSVDQHIDSVLDTILRPEDEPRLAATRVVLKERERDND